MTGRPECPVYSKENTDCRMLPRFNNLIIDSCVPMMESDISDCKSCYHHPPRACTTNKDHTSARQPLRCLRLWQSYPRSANIEGLSSPKRDLIAKLCCEHNCQVLCLQETHRGPNNNRPTITGMKMAIERPHEKYGSAIYVKPDLVITSTSMTENNDIEILTVNVGSITITSV